MNVDADLLRGVPLFSGMTDRALAAVAELGEEVTFEAGDRVVTEGEPGDAFFVILDGTASVVVGARAVSSLGPGDTLGEISLVDGRPRSATVTSETRVRAVVIRRPGFERLMDDFPPVRLGVLMSLTERIRSDEHAATA